MEGLMLAPNKPGLGNLIHATTTTTSTINNNYMSGGGGGGVGGGIPGIVSGGSGYLGMNSLTGISMGSRSSSASSAERSLLLGALATHMGVLDARENDAQTIIRKSELWDEVTRQFNAQTLAPRSRQQIQTLYKNMKAKARRYEARLAEVASGVPPPDPDPISEMLLGLLHQQMQHQRRHLQRLAVIDNFSHALTPPGHTLSGDGTMKPMNTHMDTTLLTPEQVMQVSLEEGLATDMEVKDEPQDHTFAASPECQLQKAEEEEEEEEAEEEEKEEAAGENIEEGESSLDIFANAGLTSPRPSSETPTSSSQQQGFLAGGAAGIDSNGQQHHQDGTTQRPFHSFTSAGQTFAPPASRSGVPGSTNHRAPSPKIPIFLPFQSSPSPHVLPHGLPSRTHPGASGEADLMSMSAKRPKLEGVSDVGRFRGCGSSLTSRHYNCCCPDLHATQAEQEHHLRMKVLKEESEAKAKEHAARMRILLLEEELLRERLRVMGRRTEGVLGMEEEAGGVGGGDAGGGDEGEGDV